MVVEIQPVDPVAYVDTDYRCAELTIVWRTPSTGDPRLIFAVAEPLQKFAEPDPTDRLRPARGRKLSDSGDDLSCGRAQLNLVDSSLRSRRY